MSTETVGMLDLSEMVDLESEPACEHSGHGKTIWHDGPATHIVRTYRPCGCKAPRTLLLCSPVLGVPFIRCKECGDVQHRADVWTVVGEL